MIEYIKTCEECQWYSRNRYEESMKFTWIIMIWVKIEVNIIYIFSIFKRFEFIIFTHDDLSEWIKEWSIDMINFQNMIRFIYKDIIYHYKYLL